jgi:predicted ester cyclase
MSQGNIDSSGGLEESDRIAIETLYRAFSEHNPDLLDEAVTEDWRDIPLAPGQAPGREGMKPLIRAFSAAFPDAHVTVHEVIGAPRRAAVRAEITGTHRGEWLGVAPTGARFTLPIHEFHHMRDGRVTHTWHMEDWFGWLHQVGAMGAGEQGR